MSNQACQCCEAPPCNSPTMEGTFQIERSTKITLTGSWSGSYHIDDPFGPPPAGGFPTGPLDVTYSGNVSVEYTKAPNQTLLSSTFSGSHDYGYTFVRDSDGQNFSYNAAWSLGGTTIPFWKLDSSSATPPTNPPNFFTGTSYAFPFPYQGADTGNATSGDVSVTNVVETITYNPVLKEVLLTVNYDLRHETSPGTFIPAGSGTLTVQLSEVQIDTAFGDFVAGNSGYAQTLFGFNAPLSYIGSGLLLRTGKYRISHPTPGTCQYKVWLDKTTQPGNGDPPTVEPAPTYTFNGLGSGHLCLADEFIRYDNGVNIVKGGEEQLDPPEENGAGIFTTIVKWSCVLAFEPEDLASSGYPDPTDPPP